MRAKTIFCIIINKLGAEDRIVLTSRQYMPLTVERLETFDLPLLGEVTRYSFCHYYKQDGDAIRDPEMCFIAVDKRRGNLDIERLEVYPDYFRQDNIGREEQSIWVNDGKLIASQDQPGHAVFANSWLLTIREHGYLEK